MSDPTHSADSSTSAEYGEGTASRYELIIVASREARRLNEYYRQRAIQPKRRITSEAIDRVFTGPGVAYEFIATSEIPASEIPAGEDGYIVGTPAESEA